MNEEKFRKMDESMMKATAKGREADPSKSVLSGFSADVVRGIREKQAAKQPAPSWNLRLALPVLAPTFAVLVLGVYIVLRDPGTSRLPLNAAPVQLAANPVSEVDEEIALLKAIGAWSEEDERAAGVAGDDSLEELEISRLGGPSSTRLA